VLAIVTFVTISGLVVFAANRAGTFAFDFLAYHQAAGRVLDGERLYDPTVGHAGGFGLFYYPPPFVLAILPLALLDPTVASWAWLALSVAMLVGGVALMPVRASVRWASLLLAGLSWPVAYALKLGQVGPLLLFLFVIGWRWLDDPIRVGVASALGTIVKIQPGILLGWAFLTRRWAAVAVGAAVLAVAAIAATLVLGGFHVWSDYLALLRNVSDPITTPHNFTPGAVAYQAGATVGVGTAVQVASSVLVIVAAIVAGVRLRSDASYLVAVIASQLLSPVLWDHYAMLLLVPVAWLLERRRWWAIAIPLATSAVTLFVGVAPVVYPLAFWATLVGVFAVGWLERPGRRSLLGPRPSSAA
jgi:hypothetical protein